MKTQHANCTHPRRSVRRFGGRRRLCTRCDRTFRVSRHGRGRPRVRVSPERAHRFVLHRVLPIRALHPGPHRSRNQQQYRLAQSRARCVASCPWPPVPPAGPLIAIADAIVKYLQGAWHTWYFIVVRRPEEHDSVILPPCHRQGTETVAGWSEAFARIDASVLSRIHALVCDGHRGLVYEAKRRSWILQRCHFHLIARLQGRRSKWKMSRNREEGERIYTLVQEVLTTRDTSRIMPALTALEEISWTSSSPEIRKVLAGFINYYEDFRTYLAHPALRLPTTNNTVEALISLVEEISSRARGFRRIATFHEWIICTIKTRKKIRCAPAGTNNQPN